MDDRHNIEITGVVLKAAKDAMAAMETFYGRLLGLAHFPGENALSFRAGTATLEFSAAAGDERPFYHFALLVPGNRFAAAHDWLAGRVDLLPHLDGVNTTFDFDFWNAQACYFHDPAGNIVEFIAHLGHSKGPDAAAPFAVDELVGLSEIGIVTANPAATARALNRDLGLDIWNGGLDGADSLAFIGRKAHTLIICRPDRGWLPTRRPAEIHQAEITLSGPHDATADLWPVPCTVSTYSPT